MVQTFAPGCENYMDVAGLNGLKVSTLVMVAGGAEKGRGGQRRKDLRQFCGGVAIKLYGSFPSNRLTPVKRTSNPAKS